MLHDIAFGAVAKQPARKGALPFIGGVIEHDQLHKGPGFLWPFPLRRAFTGAYAHQRAADADALTRLERDFAHQPVTFVEQAKHGNAFRHRRRAGINIVCAARRLRARQRFIRLRRCGLIIFIAARAQRGHQRQSRCPKQGAG